VRSDEEAGRLRPSAPARRDGKRVTDSRPRTWNAVPRHSGRPRARPDDDDTPRGVSDECAAASATWQSATEEASPRRTFVRETS